MVASLLVMVTIMMMMRSTQKIGHKINDIFTIFMYIGWICIVLFINKYFDIPMNINNVKKFYFSSIN